MKKALAMAAIAAAILASIVGAARAVTGGTPDNGAHPYVVLLRVHLADGTYDRCSGSLVSATKVVTAAHCLVNATSVDVWATDGPVTTQAPEAVSESFAAEPFAGVGAKNVDSHDLAVVTLSGAGLPGSRYATIAPLGYDDTLAKKTTLTLVGYGLQDVKPTPVTDRVRIDGLSTVANTKDPFNLKLSSSTNGSAGACYGDSGGPVLDGDMIVGVASYVTSQNCTGGYYAYRVDTSASREFLAANGVSS
jgi:secreted trypsin-like serine protease